ncbi:hypothetical protein [Aeoliella sp. SH292]|uniref:hypothetical protein n=1 Tax=Aeoliella sp. SH292 TaxID=3454464 RepID=UPI003F9C5988
MPPTPQLPQQVRVMQIIALAMVMSIVTLGVIVVLVLKPEPPEGGEQPLISYIAIAVATIAAFVGVLAPRILTAHAPPTVSTYMTAFIIGAAVYEGAAFFNLTSYILEGFPVSLAFAGLMVVFILMLFPTQGRVEDWIASRERHAREIEAFKR